MVRIGTVHSRLDTVRRHHWGGDKHKIIVITINMYLSRSQPDISITSGDNTLTLYCRIRSRLNRSLLVVFQEHLKGMGSHAFYHTASERGQDLDGQEAGRYVSTDYSPAIGIGEDLLLLSPAQMLTQRYSLNTVGQSYNLTPPTTRSERTRSRISRISSKSVSIFQGVSN